jgi:hypothetical protein
MPKKRREIPGLHTHVCEPQRTLDQVHVFNRARSVHTRSGRGVAIGLPGLLRGPVVHDNNIDTSNEVGEPVQKGRALATRADSHRQGATPDSVEVPLRVISQTTGKANLIECTKLALRDAETQVLRVSRVRNEKTFGTLFEDVVLPLDKFPGLAAWETVPDVADLAERFDLPIARVAERIRLVEAPGNVAQHLGIAAGTGVVKLDRITETIGGEPIEWRVAYVWKAA